MKRSNQDILVQAKQQEKNAREDTLKYFIKDILISLYLGYLRHKFLSKWFSISSNFNKFHRLVL